MDYAKALAIVLVVFGHEDTMPDGIVHWIFSFHMPLFFVLSGVLLRTADLALSPLVFARKRLLRLL